MRMWTYDGDHQGIIWLGTATIHKYDGTPDRTIKVHLSLVKHHLSVLGAKGCQQLVEVEQQDWILVIVWWVLGNALWHWVFWHRKKMCLGRECENVTYEGVFDHKGHKGTAEEDIRLLPSSAGYNNLTKLTPKEENWLGALVINKQENNNNREWSK